MKKLLALLLAISLLFCLAACDSGTPSSGDKKENQENCAETGKHTLGDWTLYAEATNFTPKETRRTCSGCKYYEYERDYTQMAEHYFDVVECLDVWFNVKQSDDCASHLVYWAFLQGVEYEFEDGNGEFYDYYTIPVANMDALTMQYFGKTFNYTGLYNDLIFGDVRCVYDETQNALSLFGFDDFTEPEKTKLEVTSCDGDDERRIVVNGTKSTLDYAGNPMYVFQYEMIIELIAGQYVITEYSMLPIQ